MPKIPKSAYFREMHPYSLEEFKDILGLIKRIGADKNGHWEIVKNEK